MKIAGKTRSEYLERRHWERFAREVGLSPAATVVRVNQLGAKIAESVAELPKKLADELSAKALTFFASGIERLASTLSKNAKRGPSDEVRTGGEIRELSDDDDGGHRSPSSNRRERQGEPSS
jgi:hypothetical protein